MFDALKFSERYLYSNKTRQDKWISKLKKIWKQSGINEFPSSKYSSKSRSFIFFILTIICLKFFLKKHEESEIDLFPHIVVFVEWNQKTHLFEFLRNLSDIGSFSPTIHIISEGSILKLIKYDLTAYHHPINIRLYDSKKCNSFVWKIWNVAKHESQHEICKLFVSQIVMEKYAFLYDLKSEQARQFYPVKPRIFENSKVLVGSRFSIPPLCLISAHLCYPSRYYTTTVESSSSEARNLPLFFSLENSVLHLERMRETGFPEKLIQATIGIWRDLHYQQAHNGVSDILTNYARVYPRQIAVLSNTSSFEMNKFRYGYMSNSSMTFLFEQLYRIHVQKNHVPKRNGFIGSYTKAVKELASQKQYKTLALVWKMNIVEDNTCNTHFLNCSSFDSKRYQSINLTLATEYVFILTRSAKRPEFFGQLQDSIKEQIYPNIVHLVGTDDLASYNTYLARSAKNTKYYQKEDMRKLEDPCKCQIDSETCGKPPKNKSVIDEYLQCYCSLQYPMNGMMNKLQSEVKNGWILYLDDDNLLVNKWSVAELVFSATETDTMLVFRSYLGRVTPTDANFNKRLIQLSDIDSSNFCFHSKNKNLALWGETRCGDFKVASYLHRFLESKWIDIPFIAANPLRPLYGGLGMKEDIERNLLTVFLEVRSYFDKSTDWIEEIILHLQSMDMKFISKTVVVFVATDQTLHTIPESMSIFSFKILLVKSKKVTFWTDGFKYMRTKYAFYIRKNEVFSKKELLCYMSWVKIYPKRLIGSSSYYSTDRDIENAHSYFVLSSRKLMLSSAMLEHVNRKMRSKIKYFHDINEDHCMDYIITVQAQSFGHKPPLKVHHPDFEKRKSMIVNFKRSFVLPDEITLGQSFDSCKSYRYWSSFTRTTLRSSYELGSCLDCGSRKHLTSVV